MRRLSVVGLGRVGTALAAALQKEGYSLQCMADEDTRALIRARAVLGDNIPWAVSVENLPFSPVFLITVKDDAIEKVAEKLRRLYPSSLLVHTSGLHTSLILGEGSRLSLHPLQSFASVEEAINNLWRSHFSLEGDETGVAWGKEVVDVLGGVAMEIKAEQKPLYHLAACIASNYLVTLIYQALEAMGAADIPRETALAGLGALLDSTVKNIKTLGVPAALTGPMVRGDVGTVEVHMEALENHQKLKEFYSFMGAWTLEMISEERLHTPVNALEAMKSVISRGSNHRKDN